MMSLALAVLRLLKAILRSWRVPAFRAALALAAILLLSGTLFFRGTEGWSWIDAFYFSAMTVATVGAGELAPQSDLGKLFTVVYVFVGVGVFVTLFAQFARALLAESRTDAEDGPAGRDDRPAG